MSHAREEPKVCAKALRAPVLAGALRSGRTPNGILADLGLAPDSIVDPTMRVPHSLANRVWDDIARMVDEPALGLFAAQVIAAAPLDFIDYALSHAPTIRAIASTFHRYQRLFHDANESQMVERDGKFELELVFANGLPTTRHMTEFVLGTWFYKLQRAAGRMPPPLSVELAHRPAADRSLYGAVFGAGVPLRFEAGRNVLVFDGAVADYPVVAADAGLHEMFMKQAEQAFQGPGGPRAPGGADAELLDRARGVLLTLLPDGDASAERLSAALDMSTRTLHRRLAAQGISFRELLDDVRARMAKSELARGATTVTDLAFLLGYANVTAFTRAFQRWTGKSPSEFRRSA